MQFNVVNAFVYFKKVKLNPIKCHISDQLMTEFQVGGERHSLTSLYNAVLKNGEFLSLHSVLIIAITHYYGSIICPDCL